MLLVSKCAGSPTASTEWIITVGMGHCTAVTPLEGRPRAAQGSSNAKADVADEIVCSKRQHSAGLASLGACRAVFRGSGSTSGFGRNSWAQEMRKGPWG